MTSKLADMAAAEDSLHRKIKQAEMELETNRRSWEAERHSLIERCAALSSSTHAQREGGGGEGEEADAEGPLLKTIAELEVQVRNLGHQLLKKQDAMQDLLSERAGLKVRLQDSNRRCTI